LVIDHWGSVIGDWWSDVKNAQRTGRNYATNAHPGAGFALESSSLSDVTVRHAAKSKTG
jgi:hypothetical protein